LRLLNDVDAADFEARAAIPSVAGADLPAVCVRDFGDDAESEPVPSSVVVRPNSKMSSVSGSPDPLSSTKNPAVSVSESSLPMVTVTSSPP